MISGILQTELMWSLQVFRIPSMKFLVDVQTTLCFQIWHHHGLESCSHSQSTWQRMACKNYPLSVLSLQYVECNPTFNSVFTQPRQSGSVMQASFFSLVYLIDANSISTITPIWLLYWLSLRSLQSCTRLHSSINIDMLSSISLWTFPAMIRASCSFCDCEKLLPDEAVDFATVTRVYTFIMATKVMMISVYFSSSFDYCGEHHLFEVCVMSFLKNWWMNFAL